MKKKVSRREVIKGAATFAAATAAGCTTLKPTSERNVASVEDDKFEFIIVGSGAGGGPLAARLAQAGFRVLLIEAGSKETTTNSQVPAFHAKATDDARINWSFFVRRYSNLAAEQANMKWVAQKQGVYYPRGSALGGSTTVNAMICLAAESKDWQAIENLTGDRSWSPREMFDHFERLQKALPDRNKFLEDLIRPQFEKGWLQLSQNNLALLLQDGALIQIVLSALSKQGLGPEVYKKLFEEGVNIGLNPNVAASALREMDGLYNIPVNIQNGVRRGVRELLLETAKRYPDKLVIQTESLAKNLIFSDTEKNRVIGVEYAEGAKLYSAHQEYQVSQAYSVKKAFASKEVILSGGTFNTPQLLQLSGIGDENFLRTKGIDPRVHLPAVGTNMQDRYEIGVVTRFPKKFSVIENCTFGEAGDPCFAEYQRNSSHLYGTNGATAAIINRSGHGRPSGYCIFGLPGNFRGYYPDWSRDAYDAQKFTWVILKGHTANRTGTVQIRSNDFRETPDINFRSFNDGQDMRGGDMEDMLDAIEFVRDINRRLPESMTHSEVWPGNGRSSREELRHFVRNESWGHHASCSCPMGTADDEKAVVDSEFKVRKVSGLRIVDASIFPEIPGLFIAVPILTVSEKAAQLLIQTYRK